MITQESQMRELRMLLKKREEIRHDLREHFALPVAERDYKRFETLVDELDGLRKRIHDLKQAS